MPSKRKPSNDLNTKFQDLKRVLYSRQDVVCRLDRLVQVTQQLGKSRARDVHELVLNQWKKHCDVSRLDAFLTEKIAERTKIYEAQDRPPRRKPPCIHKINYGRMALNHLREAYSPEQLSIFLDQPESLCSLGPILFKKWDDEFHTKFPEAHIDVNERKKWRASNFHLKSLVKRALPANVRHNGATQKCSSPHQSGGVSQRWDSLLSAAEIAARADQNGGRVSDGACPEDLWTDCDRNGSDMEIDGDRDSGAGGEGGGGAPVLLLTLPNAASHKLAAQKNLKELTERLLENDSRNGFDKTLRRLTKRILEKASRTGGELPPLPLGLKPAV